MGADLYIDSIFEPNLKRFEKKFNAAVKQRDELIPYTGEWKKAHAAVDCYFEKMYSRGYFRDSYNGSSLLWSLGLSWWTDVNDLLDEECNLQGLALHEFRDLIAERSRVYLTLEEIKEYMVSRNDALPNSFDEPPEEILDYMQAKATRLLAFLDEAITLEEPVRCSI